MISFERYFKDYAENLLKYAMSGNNIPPPPTGRIRVDSDNIPFSL